jgi:hypothetical protein
MLKNLHRDGVWKLLGRICDTVSVFAYQSGIMYVQLVVSNVAMECVDGDCGLSAPKDNLMTWLYIEMYCFYMYLIAAVFYIGFHQIVEGVCCMKTKKQSDMQKAITDFVEYSYRNLIWFSLNFVLVMMPLVCMFIINAKATNLDIAGENASYLPLLWSLCIVNLV